MLTLGCNLVGLRSNPTSCSTKIMIVNPGTSGPICNQSRCKENALVCSRPNRASQAKKKEQEQIVEGFQQNNFDKINQNVLPLSQFLYKEVPQDEQHFGFGTFGRFRREVADSKNNARCSIDQTELSERIKPML